ncbi:MAG: glutamyl-tRNA reductase [Planctomycetota bacterium]|jgi:glutamyl-tRNA reductase
MSFEVVGASHKTASLELRERITLGAEDRATLRRLKRDLCLDELVVLSTCNRFELYFIGCADSVVEFLAGRGGFPPAEAHNVMYGRGGAEAALHLFSVAAGLDSMVVGETEVLSQCKSAYEAALAAGVTGPVLNAAFQRAFEAAKKVHRRTALSRGRISVGSLAKALVSGKFGDLSGRTLVVIGAGTMARNALANLSELDPDEIIVVNRSRKSAAPLARKFGARTEILSRLAGILAKADVVVASAASPKAILTAGAVRRSQKKRGYRPCFLLDIAVPRNIDLAAGDVKGVTLLNIDSLQGLADRNAGARRRECPKARRIIETEAAKLERLLAERTVAPVITALQSKMDAVAEREVRRSLKRLKAGAAPEEELRKLATALSKRFLHGPVSALKEAAANGGAQEISRAALKLYGLAENDES